MHIFSWRSLASSYLPLPWDPLPLGPPSPKAMQSRGPSHRSSCHTCPGAASLPWLLGLSPWPPVYLCGSSLLPSGAAWLPGDGTWQEEPQRSVSVEEASSTHGWGQRRGLGVCCFVGPSAGGTEHTGPAPLGGVLCLRHHGHQPVPRGHRGSSWKRQVRWGLNVPGGVPLGERRSLRLGDGVGAGSPAGGGAPSPSSYPPSLSALPGALTQSVLTVFLKLPHPCTPSGTLRPRPMLVGGCPEPDLDPAFWKLRFPCVSGALGLWLPSQHLQRSGALCSSSDFSGPRGVQLCRG